MADSDFVIENRIWNPAAETMKVSEIKDLQLRRLRETVEYAKRVPFYRAELEKRHITGESIRSLDDIRKLPFTVKQNMRDNYPFGLFAVKPSELARIHGSSGTTGTPTMVGYTKNDLKLWAELCSRFLVAGGLTPDQITQIAFGYGLFTGGFGLHYGIENVGAAVVPASSGNTQRQIALLRDLGVETLICTPSYALNLAEALEQMNLNHGEIALRYAHFGGEPWTEMMRDAIESKLPIHAFNNYGLSEVIGPGVAGECAARRGMHIQEDHFIFECINPETLEPVAEGEVGELVITALGKEACPVLRYRTRDLASIYRTSCPCGRTGMMMSRVKGRTDDMLIIRGVNVFPSQVEEALLKINGVTPHYLIELYRPHNLDEAVLKVELAPHVFSDKMDEMIKLKDRITRDVTAYTGIHFKLELVEPNSLERATGKAKYVADHRNLKVE
ncbi:MAG: phenylacetate--CoA ligase [Victivallaceae bacterium]|nr:phenylacetate--CoA ligase [Victivallaceae bacterium]